MKVDIILSTFNGETFILDQLKSICHQTFKDFKIIIRDDNSSDKTIQIATEYLEKENIEFKIVVDDLGNLGPEKSFKTLLNHTNSELIVLCDQDDIWANDKLEKLIQLYNSDAKKNIPALIFSNANLIDTDGHSLNKTIHKKLKWKQRNFNAFIFNNYVQGCTMMINAQMKDAYLKMQTSIGIHDYPMILIALHYSNFAYTSENLTSYRLHENNTIGLSKGNLTLKVKDLLKYMWLNKKYREIIYTKRISSIKEIVDQNTEIQYSTLVSFLKTTEKSYLIRKIQLSRNGYLKSGRLVDKLLILFCY
jgi:rhamnosyltransferase